MVVGTPKEIKPQEHRVGMTPVGVRSLCDDGHRVLIETGAGVSSGFSNEQYQQAGAEILTDVCEIYARAELVVKVKEPLGSELSLLRQGQLLFTFLHLAANLQLTEELLSCGVTAIGYETVTLADGSLPLLIPMSEIAGRMAPQIGAHYLQRENRGKGVLLSGVPGVRSGHVVVLGAGTVGSNALRIAVGMGADVTILDLNPRRLTVLDEQYGNRIQTLMSNSQNIEEETRRADLLIGAILVRGSRAPQLVSRQLVNEMDVGSVIVDVAVDQGGCVATTRPTTHDQPIHLEAGVLHYGVTNMPGAVSRTSTWALTNSTLPYVLQLANQGNAALRESTELQQGVNVHAGQLTNQAVACSLDMPWKELGCFP